MSQLTDNLNLIASIKSDIKSAIENKGVDMTGVSFPGYPAAISQISGGGGAVIKALQITSNGTYTAGAGVDGYSPVEVDVPAPEFVTETLSVSENGTYIPPTDIDGWDRVTVNVPQIVSGIDEKEFTEGNLNIINISNSASFVGSSVYLNRKNIQTVYLPNCLYVDIAAFDNCTSLYSVELPICKSLYNAAFYSCYSLQSISIPNCEYLGYQVFGECYNLTKIDLPNLISASGSPFIECRNLSEISIPNCEYLSNYTFQGCSALTKLILPKCSHLGNSVFFKCINLSEVTIEYSSVCETGAIATSWTGVVYVPSSLVDSYKTALNWSTISSRIFPIPE